jgi:hypothetical protein
MVALNIYDGKGNPVAINVRSFELRLFGVYVGWITCIDVAPTTWNSSNVPFSLKFPNNKFVHFTNNHYDDVVLSVDPPQFEGKFNYLNHSVVELASTIKLSDFYPQIEEVSND